MVLKMGPAGLGGVKTAEKVLEDYHSKGFKACEIAFTYSAYIKNEKDAKRIGKKAKELGIDLSIHASYFVNLNSAEKDKIKASKERILECCRVGEQLGVKVVVFHPGYYGKGDREDAYENIKKNVLDIMKEIKKRNGKLKLLLKQWVKLMSLEVLKKFPNWLMKRVVLSVLILHIFSQEIKKLIMQKSKNYSLRKNGIAIFLELFSEKKERKIIRRRRKQNGQICLQICLKIRR